MNALHRDPAGPPGNGNGVGNAVQAVDQDADIGSLRGSAGAAGAHGDPDIGLGQGRRIVKTLSAERQAARRSARTAQSSGLREP
jgi:hypothetical protein